MLMDIDLSKELTEKLEKVLAQFGEEHAVVVSVSSVEFHQPMGIVRSFAYVKNGDAIRFGEKAKYYGMSDQDYYKEVEVNGKIMHLVDCHTNRHKYPFVVVDANGKRWKISAETAKK
jgi:hypothetical protein